MQDLCGTDPNQATRPAQIMQAILLPPGNTSQVTEIRNLSIYLPPKDLDHHQAGMICRSSVDDLSDDLHDLSDVYGHAP